MTNNLKKLRKAAGLTQEGLGRLCDPQIPGVYISRYESGAVGMPTEVLSRISKALKTTPSEILGFDPAMNAGVAMVPMLGYVGAGAIIYSVDDHAKGAGIEEVECPQGMNPKKSFALEVRGDSMEPMISDGFLLFYEDRFSGVPVEYISKICVVQVVDGPLYVKKLKNGTKIGHYKLCSLNPNDPDIEDVLVDWSAKVKVMVQR